MSSLKWCHVKLTAHSMIYMTKNNMLKGLHEAFKTLIIGL